jgi:hypothetical protein
MVFMLWFFLWVGVNWWDDPKIGGKFEQEINLSLFSFQFFCTLCTCDTLWEINVENPFYFSITWCQFSVKWKFDSVAGTFFFDFDLNDLFGCFGWLKNGR